MTATGAMMLRHYSVYRFGTEYVALASEWAYDQAMVWRGWATHAATAAEAAKERSEETERQVTHA